MIAKELPRRIPSKRLKTLHVARERNSMHAVVPSGDNDTETSQTLQRRFADAWLRPCMRPHWLKVDPRRAQISIEVVGSAGEAKGKQGKVDNHAQLFELTLDDVPADAQPQRSRETS